MRKISLYSLLALVLVASCRRTNDRVFDKSPEERINETLGQYQSVISGATDGWIGSLMTGDSSFFSFYFRFNNSNRVVMMTDFSTETATTPMESSYRLKALQQPVLIFDTYGYIHILSDPDANQNGGEFGQGRLSDFEYAIDTVTNDSIRLTGRFNNAKLNLKKATAQQRAAWENKQIATTIGKLRDLSRIHKYFKRLTLSSVDYEIKLDTFAKKAVITWVTNGTAQTVTRGYYVTPDGIQFSEPVVNGGSTIPGFTIVSFNNGTLVMNVTVNGTAGSIAGADKPLNPDAEAFDRFVRKSLAAGIYWVSWDGFHKDGVDDAFNMKSLATDSSTFYHYIYYPEFEQDIDLMAPIYMHTLKQEAQLNYGAGIDSDPNVNTKQVRLRDIGELGDYPVSGPAYQARTFVANSQYFWFVQTGPRSYDMVSVDDPKVWVTWVWPWD